MKKLKKFQKFALSVEQASKVKGGVQCHANGGSTYFETFEAALTWCGDNESICNGCF